LIGLSKGGVITSTQPVELTAALRTGNTAAANGYPARPAGRLGINDLQVLLAGVSKEGAEGVSCHKLAIEKLPK
jgi:hypothetical protein